MMKKAASLLSAALSVVVIPVFSAGEALAAPSGCWANVNGKSVIGTCPHGKGEFRIRADCARQPDHKSPWTAAGNLAAVECTFGGARSWSFEVR